MSKPVKLQAEIMEADILALNLEELVGKVLHDHRCHFTSCALLWCLPKSRLHVK